MKKEMDMLTKSYEIPTLNVILWDKADVVTLSFGDNDVDDDFEFGE